MALSFNPLTAISPIDGRYHPKTSALAPVFSEFGLMRYRVLTEITWLQALANHPDIRELPPLSDAEQSFLMTIFTDFSEKDAYTIKEFEKKTNHDVKAIEYFLKERIGAQASLAKHIEFVHFACTSEDINSVSYALMLKEWRDEHLVEMLKTTTEQLRTLAHRYAGTAMLSRTHGQAASPTTVGKEFSVFVARLERQMKTLKEIKCYAKMSGAVGNYNAHCVAYPNVDWVAISNQVLTDLGLSQQLYTTQIEPHDYIAELAHVNARINSIFIDFAQDIWGYISLGYFKQKLNPGETGSSTMPHKVNPIDFENAEGNLGLANALFNHFAMTLPTSRWQRDLTDSTLLRNLGVACAHSVLAYQSLQRGVNKLEINEGAIQHDLADNLAVLGEAIQTVMRRHGVPQAYEKLKSLTRGKTITEAEISQFIDQLELRSTDKEQLKQLSPESYIGLAKSLAEKI